MDAKAEKALHREELRAAQRRRQEAFDREAARHQREGAEEKTMREQWTPGARQDGYTVEKATLSGVTVRHESGAVCTLAPKLDRGRAYVTLHSRSRFARRLYADEMA